MLYDFVIIGAGIAGSSIAHFLKDRFKLLVIDKNGICQKASNAAGAFLFPKVGFDTKYTRFINDALLFSFSFYKNLDLDTHKDGVLILPRDERDISKFENYKSHIRLPFEEKEGGFFFYDGGYVNSEEVCEKLLENAQFLSRNVKVIHKKDNYYLIDNLIKTKNIVLATGWEEIIEIPYIKIRPVWGERIEIKTSVTPKYNYHKNCSVSKNRDGIVRIGATHKRVKEELTPNREEAEYLLKKANEILEIDGTVHSMKGGMRAGSIDYFPIVGPVIDTEKSLEKYPEVMKGKIPDELFYVDGLYVINGGGGRGFSNYPYVAKMLADYIIENRTLPKEIDTKRIFIKWARKLHLNDQ